jgi:hypothetical protein
MCHVKDDLATVAGHIWTISRGMDIPKTTQVRCVARAVVRITRPYGGIRAPAYRLPSCRVISIKALSFNSFVQAWKRFSIFS